MYLYHCDVLPATSISACTWASIEGDEALVVARAKRLEIYSVRSNSNLLKIASIDLFSTISEAGTLESPDGNDLIAVSFSSYPMLCICRIDLEAEAAFPIFVYDAEEGAITGNTLPDRLNESSIKMSMRVQSLTVVIAVGRELVVLPASSFGSASGNEAFRAIEHSSHFAILDFAVVPARDSFHAGSCSLVVALRNMMIEGLSIVRHFNVRLDNRQATKLWETTNVPGVCMKLLCHDIDNIIIFSANRVTRLGKYGYIEASMKLSALAEAEGPGVETSVSIELYSDVQAASLREGLVVVFVSYTAWLLHTKTAEIVPLARLASGVSSVAVNKASNLMFIGSRTDDSLLIRLRLNGGFKMLPKCDITTRNFERSDGAFYCDLEVCDSLFSLGAIVDATFSVKCTHSWPFQRQNPTPQVKRAMSELVVCCSSGLLASLSSRLALESSMVIRQVAAAVGTGSWMIVQTPRNSLRKFLAAGCFLKEEALVDSACGMMLAAADGRIICEHSVSGFVLKAASSCCGVAVAVTRQGELLELIPRVQRRTDGLYDTVTLSSASQFSHECNLVTTHPFTASCAYPDATTKMTRVHEKACVRCKGARNMQALSDCFCVCASLNAGPIVVFNAQTWQLVYRSLANLANRPRCLLDANRESFEGVVTNDIRLHLLTDGFCGSWCLVVLVNEELSVFKRCTEFRRIDTDILKGTELTPFDSIESRSGVFVACGIHGAVILMERGTIHIVETCHGITLTLRHLYGWISGEELCLGTGFGNIILTDGRLVAHKIFLGPSVVKGHCVVTCCSETPPLFAALVDTCSLGSSCRNAYSTMQFQQQHRPTSAWKSVWVYMPNVQQTRSEVRLVTASNRIHQACLLLENEQGVCMRRLVTSGRIYVCVGTHRRIMGHVEHGRPRGRLLIFQVINRRLTLVIVREMPGLVSCLNQLGDSSLAVAVGAKFEIYSLCPVPSDNQMQLRQLAQHHTCGPFIATLTCVKHYAFYTTPRGSRFLFWRPEDKLVTEIGQHYASASQLALIIDHMQLAALIFNSSSALIVGNNIFQNQRPLSCSSMIAANHTAPVTTSVLHPLSPSSWASAVCCADGGISTYVAVSEAACRELFGLQRIVANAVCAFEGGTTTTTGVLNGAVLSRAFNMTRTMQTHLAAAIAQSWHSPGLSCSQESARHIINQVYTIEAWAKFF